MEQGLLVTRGQLAQMRAKAADNVQGQHHTEALNKLVQIHLAIEAIDAVLAERGAAPEKSPWDDPKYKL